MGSNIDLRELQSPEKLQSILGKVLSGKHGYQPVIERRKEPKLCSSCKHELKGNEKFCPECGNKTNTT